MRHMENASITPHKRDLDGARNALHFKRIHRWTAGRDSVSNCVRILVLVIAAAPVMR